MMKVKKFQSRKPFSSHSHLRELDMLSYTVPLNKLYSYVVYIGNISVYVSTNEQEESYRADIHKKGPEFIPVPTIMLTKDTTADTLKRAYDRGVKMAKLMPDGATTNAKSGIMLHELERIYHLYDVMQDIGMISSIHCELAVDPKTGLSIPLIDREEAGLPFFKDKVKAFPRLKTIFEHASTKAAIDFIINECGDNVRMGLTPQHLSKTYDDVFDTNGKIINPANLCLPVLKLEKDVKAARKAIASDKSFYGPDDAPHPIDSKLNTDKPAFGVFNPPSVALSTVAEVMEEEGVLHLFEDFTLIRGLNFYELPLPPEDETITFIKESWTVPDRYYARDEHYNMIPFRHGETIKWQIEEAI
jgi:dihydroorotase (homodimeric type)